ncbi:hypothetical protein [Streptomyces chartreusis]|uniref:hypothetical protein n=1 Tax=Streptomyces chartreusis TaxID=1969 RepID=UPI003810291A
MMLVRDRAYGVGERSVIGRARAGWMTTYGLRLLPVTVCASATLHRLVAHRSTP